MFHFNFLSEPDFGVVGLIAFDEVDAIFMLCCICMYILTGVYLIVSESTLPFILIINDLHTYDIMFQQLFLSFYQSLLLALLMHVIQRLVAK